MKEQEEEQEESFTMDITPKWEGLLPLYAEWFCCGNSTQIELAEKEFKKIGEIMDGINDGTYTLTKNDDKELKEKGLVKDD